MKLPIGANSLRNAVKKAKSDSSAPVFNTSEKIIESIPKALPEYFAGRKGMEQSSFAAQEVLNHGPRINNTSTSSVRVTSTGISRRTEGINLPGGNNFGQS